MLASNAILSIDLVALRANYQLLKNRHTKQSIGAVVKANAYGLGVEAVSKALWDEGCREFFVATLDEGLALRGVLPEAHIAVFQGPFTGEENEYATHRLMPVLNTLEQVGHFQGSGARDQGSVIFHVDTGMTRLGLSHSDLEMIAARPLIPGLRSLMSHLACSGEPAHPKNAEQLLRFKQALALFPGIRASFCNSAGLFLPHEFHFDFGRPGCALYGINPTESENPMRHVATLFAPILQIRSLDKDETVGYGATYTAKKGSRIAIVAFGYADGMFRHLSNKGFAFVAGEKVPFAGRVSMDMIALDVTHIPEARLKNTRAEFINAEYTVSDLARDAGTIGYEVLTRIGSRVKRVYSH